MIFSNTNASVFIPNEENINDALAKTTDLCIAAHHDDIEIMAYGAIAACYNNDKRHFSGVIVTDGGGSPRAGAYGHYTDDDMKLIRVAEQKTAAKIGRYSAQVFLAHPSSDVKSSADSVCDNLKNIITTCNPETLYTHNLADKHDTHVAVALNVIKAVRELPMEKRPKKIVSLEVWRSLDWLCDEDKVVYDTAPYPNIASAIVNVFDSQVSGGKRYDLAALGRRVANATFFASHSVDEFESASFGLDITGLVNSTTEPEDFILMYINKFKDEVISKIKNLKGGH